MSDELLLVVQVVANEGGTMDIFQLPKMFLELGPYRIRRLRYSPSLPNEFARLSMPAAHTNLKHESRVVSTALPMHPEMLQMNSREPVTPSQSVNKARPDFALGIALCIHDYLNLISIPVFRVLNF